MFMDTLEAEVVLQCLAAGWRAGKCYQQPLQDVSAPSDPGTAPGLSHLDGGLVRHFQCILVVLRRSGLVSQVPVCSFATPPV